MSGYALFTAGPRAAVLDLMARARSRRLAVTVDPASSAFLAEVGPAAFLDWTAEADICFPNEAEAAVLAGTTEPTRQRELLAARYRCVVIKRGAEGAEVVRDGQVLSLPAPVVAAVDTTGAGDAFLARFLAGLLANEPQPRILGDAIAMGVLAATTFGGRPLVV